eukprot:7183833-Ditylum_brightwellii.AAC.1
MPTTPAGKRKFYCKMQGLSRTHNTKDCFELKQCAKRAKPSTNCDEADKVSYKDLNASVNAKVESSKEEDEPNKHAPAAADNNDSSASCLLSDDSDNNVK